MLRPLALLASVALVVLAACGNDGGVPGSRRVDVVASFYPLAFITAELGGDAVSVADLTPPGAEPHDLELTPSQVRALAEAELVVYLGGGFQPALEQALATNDAHALDVLTTQSDLRSAEDHGHEDEEAHEEEVHEEEEAHADEGIVDPHVWLDPMRAVEMARGIADELVALDPDNASSYRANADALTEDLTALDEEFRTGLANCDRDAMVTSHEAFGYLADAYGIEQVGIAGIDPEAEPTPQRVAEVARFVAANDITTIYFEVLVAPDIAETLAREAGVQTAMLDPLEGPPEDGDYFTAMRANLDALRAGLGCA